MPRPSRRDHLVRVALDLFAEFGFHGCGIELLTERAGVSRRTLYGHFASKDDLILAVLERYDASHRAAFVTDVERTAASPGDRALALFDVAEAWFRSERFFGSLIVNAVAEFSAPDSPVRRKCEELDARRLETLRAWAAETGVSDPDTIADALALLLDGATVIAQVQRRPEAAQIAKVTASVLLERALAAPAPAVEIPVPVPPPADPDPA